MSASRPRVVAELGRPETPEEAAQRKAESSRVYRSSQTTRNLIAALLVTFGVVLIVVLIVPRGENVAASRIDVAAVAADISAGYDRTVIVPQVPADWPVNAAEVSGPVDPAWTVVYAPGSAGFVRFAQGFDVGEDWPARVLQGAAPDGTVMIGDIEWTRYEIADPSRAGNVSYALETTAGTDRVLIYGAVDPDTAALVASGVADQITALREESR